MDAWHRLVRGVNRAAVALVVAAIRGYQWLLSPLFGATCRFRPTCSEYVRIVVERDGIVTGTLRGLARIARCHPWHPGGDDPP